MLPEPTIYPYFIDFMSREALGATSGQARIIPQGCHLKLLVAVTASQVPRDSPPTL